MIYWNFTSYLISKRTWSEFLKLWMILILLMWLKF